MKFLTKIFAIALAAVMVFAFAACSEESDDKNKQFGYAFEVESEEVETTAEGATETKKVLTIKGFYVAQGTLNQIASGIAEYEDIVIGEGDFAVYTEADGAQFDENGKIKANDSFDKYDEIVIDKDAFANQKLIGTVKMTEKVTKMGTACFAGCANITKMELPFVGTQATGVYNADKTFASLFGSTEVSGCTSLTLNYNSSGSATYYLPDGLTEVTVKYSAEASELPAYAFAGVTMLENVTLYNVTELGRNAFAGCTSLTDVTFGASDEEAANLKVIGEAAFSGCTSLYGLDLTKFKAEDGFTVYHEAFSGCTKLGLGFASIKLPAGVYMDKAFYGCTSLKNIDLGAVSSIGDNCFSECSALESVTFPSDITKIGKHAFSCCEKLVKAGEEAVSGTTIVDALGNVVVKN